MLDFMSVCACLQATLPAKPGIKNSTFKPYMWGVALAYAAIAYCYFAVAFAGYWAFGNRVQSNIMLSVAHPTWLIAVANMLVVIHVFGSYQVNISGLTHSGLTQWYRELDTILGLAVQTCIWSSCAWKVLT